MKGIEKGPLINLTTGRGGFRGGGEERGEGAVAFFSGIRSHADPKGPLFELF